MRLETDSAEYDLLEQAIRMAPKGQYLSCEIGTRKGGSSQMIMEWMSQHSPGNSHVAIDPYGNVPYATNEHDIVQFDYTNDMRNQAIPELFKIAANLNVNFVFFNMRDTEFFKRFSDGVPLYYDGRVDLRNAYNFVFLDGPHQSDLVQAEVEFFAPRMAHGATLVVDDYKLFDMEKLHTYIVNVAGLKFVAKGEDRKVIYQK